MRSILKTCARSIPLVATNAAPSYIRSSQTIRTAVRCFSLTQRSSRDLPFPVFRDVPSLRNVRKQMYKDSKEIGFVPTMGALHDGHLSLVRRALQENTDVFVSIFVNPTQFGVNEDLDSYPKTWESDMQKLIDVQEEHKSSAAGKEAGKICGIFAPTVKVMYPTTAPSSEIDGKGSFVTITPLGEWLEGATRPVFFRGVATVCTKLFNVIQPDRVYFGQKDVQQCVLIRRMVKDFHIPTDVRVIPTSRESDGLAMSSRNVYLGERRRKDVGILARALMKAQEIYNRGERSAEKIRQAAFDTFRQSFAESEGVFVGAQKLEIIYITLSAADDMTTIDDGQNVNPDQGAILSAAMKVWPVEEPQNDEESKQIPVRLIDNVILEPQTGQ